MLHPPLIRYATVEDDADFPELRQLDIVLYIALVDYLDIVVYPVSGIGPPVLSLRPELWYLPFSKELLAGLIQIQLGVYKGHRIDFGKEWVILFQMGRSSIEKLPLAQLLIADTLIKEMIP